MIGDMAAAARRLAVAAVILCVPVHASAQTPSLGALFGGPFTLTGADGAPVTEADFHGKHLLIYFGYTYCPDICPTDLAGIAVALDALGPLSERVRPVFVSVDPARDTPERAADYAAAFHPSIIGLSGTEAQVAAAVRAWRVHRRKVPVEGEPDDAYMVDHSSITYLMGPDGGFETLFPHGTPPERMATVLRTYLR